ncbi:PPR domain-containing protein/PPR_2 domain-containing protein/PPR_3 domain-containing protein [Cephalotus follicularis]|uniref:PPR domain-containing protein/PPR_2 domain-containing protein/PPR_3 domain-containing protein n=1 Tax=Cephalotus follicularis TaxID=3775 RepID=A0A1Q3BNU9_CEPFO|nr:PPR domain-containing protein/PPR_2 domain-containing protein/PPR_3 domain-containing protein [Cephalotus follicularis]
MDSLRHFCNQNPFNAWLQNLFVMPYSSEFLLQCLQHCIRHHVQTKQIHSLLITKGHLINNTKNTSTSKWQSTLLYNTLIRAHLNFKKPYNSLLLFTHMLAHQAPPNSHTFPPLLKAAASSLHTLGTSLHTQALKWGVLIDPFIQTSLLNFYAQVGNLYIARKVFDEISNPCAVECNAMINACCKSGEMGSAVLILNSMPKRDVVSWTSVINGFVMNGCSVEAVQFFRKMMCCSVRPNEATYVTVLSLCANLGIGGGLCRGKQIHGHIVRNELALTVFMGTSLIDLYGKQGCLESAIRVFDRMMDREVCTWNAMISSLASNGREMQALDMFEKMEVEALCPNEVTFVAVLTACARAKLVDIGLELFQSMSREFGILPLMEHYGCVVDLLGRAGLLREANEFVKNMPFEPDASVLGALLGACKIHVSIDIGTEVGKRLLEMRPQHCGQYVVFANINAEVERWGPAADLRKSMVEAGIKKIPAHSVIDSLLKCHVKTEQFI